MQNFNRAFFLIITWAFLNGCSYQDQIQSGILAIDATSNKMSGTALEIRDAIEKLQMDMPKKAKELIQNDLNSLVQSAINSTSNQFKCDVEFVRTRFSNGLANLKRKLTLKLSGHEADSIPVLPTPPTICDCNPLVIDQDKTVRSLTFSGFDIPAKLQMVGVKSNGSTVDMSKGLAYPNDYNITFAIDQNSLNIFERLRLLYPGMTNRDVLIIPKKPLLCQQSTINPLPNPAGYSFTAEGKYGPGDGDFDGHGPKIVIDGHLKISPDMKSVVCQIAFDAQETEDDHTAVNHSKEFTIYTADGDKKIVEIISPKEFHYSYVDDNHNEDPFGANGFVTSALLRGDHNKDDIPTYTGATLNFGTLKLVVSECCNGCVSQAELEEIVAKNSLLYSDFKKLDSLSKIVLKNNNDIIK